MKEAAVIVYGERGGTSPSMLSYSVRCGRSAPGTLTSWTFGLCTESPAEFLG
jgi:hypothetical protein